LKTKRNLLKKALKGAFFYRPVLKKKEQNMEQYAVIPLRDIVVFPTMITPIFVGRKRSLNAVEIANDTDKKIFLTLQKNPESENPKKDDIYQIGVVAEILQTLKLPDGTNKVLVEGLYRAKVVDYIEDTDCNYVTAQRIDDVVKDESVNDVLRETLLKTFGEYARRFGKIPKELFETISQTKDMTKLIYMVASNVATKITELQEVLEINEIDEKIEKLIEIIETEIEISKIDERIKQRVKAQMTKAQREYYLNEQIKAINKELGRDEDLKADLQEIEDKIKSLNLNEQTRDKVLKELKKLKSMPPMSSEATVVRNYLDWLISLPWNEYTEDKLDIDNAEKILERDHYGLEKPKERILEFLAVKKLSNNLKGPILCFVGPPGVGKTSLAKSIAEAMGRKFVRMSLGGVRDEAEIRGHRRTYIGSMPGKIIQSMKKAGSMNPVFLLDEIDKIGVDFRGDPASALLETLDPEQNSTFIDHYLEVEFDLSKVFFITTANSLETIPHPLLDRMEVIRVSGYTEKEKHSIARKFLIPKQLKEHGLSDEQVKITDSAIICIIRHYTREAGVRNLQREIGSVIRKAAKKFVSSEKINKIEISGKNIEKYLGIKRYRLEDFKEERGVGVATGLAWTPFGGEILQTEVAIFEGTGKLIITGHIGDVMQESAQIAYSVAKSRASKFGIPGYMFKDYDIHLHVPEGAVPKDGPSAGITMATAIISALSKKEVNLQFAMTGEITLRGKVLAVGGIKEKVLAAHRNGIREIILPAQNKKDLTEIPDDVRRVTQFCLAETIDEVLDKVIIK
jgi:ATP-dependent Lon protease